MEVIGGPVLRLVLMVIDLYMWIVIIGVVLSWLTSFNVINSHNQFVYMVGTFTYRMTEPVLAPIRNFLYRIFKNLGGIDLSPVVLILLLIFLKDFLVQIATNVD